MGDSRASSSNPFRFAWEEPWHASFQRKLFWYVFGYFAVMVMFGIAVLLYGDPITGTDGLLPWRRISDWNVAQVMSYMVVSLTITGNLSEPSSKLICFRSNLFFASLVPSP